MARWAGEGKDSAQEMLKTKRPPKKDEVIMALLKSGKAAFEALPEEGHKSTQ